MNIYDSLPNSTQLNTQLLTGDDLHSQLLELTNKLTHAQNELKTASLDWASAENAYRQAKAISYLTIKSLPDNVKATVATLEAMVDKSVQEERQRAYIARSLKEAALENVRSIRAQLSALQSIAASVRSELELAGKVNY